MFWLQGIALYFICSHGMRGWGWGNWFIVKSPISRWDGLGKGILSKMVPQGTWLRESYIGRMVFQLRLFVTPPRAVSFGQRITSWISPSKIVPGASTYHQKSLGYQSHQQPITTITNQPGCRSGSWYAPWMHNVITTTSMWLALFSVLNQDFLLTFWVPSVTVVNFMRPSEIIE